MLDPASSTCQLACAHLCNLTAHSLVFDSRACCRYGLQRISPLMSNVVAVQEGGKVEMRWTPEGMALPAERSTLQIEPMKLVVGRGDFVSKIANLLGLKDRYSRD